MIYATYTILAAHSLALGATMIGIVLEAINKIKKLKKLLQIPENYGVIMLVIIEHPKYKYKRALKKRNPKINWIE